MKKKIIEIIVKAIANVFFAKKSKKEFFSLVLPKDIDPAEKEKRLPQLEKEYKKYCEDLKSKVDFVADAVPLLVTSINNLKPSTRRQIADILPWLADLPTVFIPLVLKKSYVHKKKKAEYEEMLEISRNLKPAVAALASLIAPKQSATQDEAQEDLTEDEEQESPSIVDTIKTVLGR